jgi:hypothetical protein
VYLGVKVAHLVVVMAKGVKKVVILQRDNNKHKRLRYTFHEFQTLNNSQFH